MKILAVVAVWLIIAAPAFAQNPDLAKYASRPILLVDQSPTAEGIMPMTFIVDGKSQIEFIPVHHIKEAIERGGHPITLADVVSALSEATQRINQLQAENDKLWKVAMKSEAVVVQPSAPLAPSQAEIAAQQQAQQQAQDQAQANARRSLALQMLLGMRQAQPQPYQLPMPVNPNANRLQTTCTTYRLGDMTHTSCN